jgi:hypothetical protein
MSEDLIISARKRDLGGFFVARSIPSAKRRHVGPFVFLDHMGPMEVDNTHALDVRPHPHIGLSTVTYLFEGRGFHRDSIGSAQMITAGDLNLMTAGRGIVHSERTPQDDKNAQPHKRLHGVQIWVALPTDQEECEPNFFHYPKNTLPDFSIGNSLSGKLLIGSYEKLKSPAKIYSPILFLELHAKAQGKEKLSFNEKEIGLFLVAGECTVNNQKMQVDDLIVVGDPKNIDIQFSADARFVVIGGEPFPEPRYIWWNFVSSRKERIHQAAQDWQNQSIGKVPTETDFIPLPSDPLP